MDPSHQTEEESAMALTDAVRDMRPLLDDAFVAYFKYRTLWQKKKDVLLAPDFSTIPSSTSGCLH